MLCRGQSLGQSAIWAANIKESDANSIILTVIWRKKKNMLHALHYVKV